MRFLDDVQCYVRELTYDFKQRTGRLDLEDGSCTDMKGCIELFKRIDPEVHSIETIAGGRKDTKYHLTDGKWEAWTGLEQRPSRVFET